MLELSEEALACLAHLFLMYDPSKAGVLSPTDLEHMFNRSPVPIYQVRAPWGIAVAACLPSTHHACMPFIILIFSILS